mmetsp:Transcript_41244/g.76726  ORF Transcript_41244/g.76726 Transcript_41244/m.76726 type:complete len:172 (+) Transcript_41244:56-571(+)
MDGLCLQEPFPPAACLAQEPWLFDPRDRQEAPKRRRMEDVSVTLDWDMDWDVPNSFFALLQRWLHDSTGTRLAVEGWHASDSEVANSSATREEGIQIFVKDLFDQTRLVQIGMTSKVSDVKEALRKKIMVESTAYYLTYIGKRLEDDRTLIDYGVLDGSTLMMNGRFPLCA